MYIINQLKINLNNLLFSSFSEVMGGGETTDNNDQTVELSDLQADIQEKQSEIKYQGKTSDIIGKGIEKNTHLIEDQEDIKELNDFQEKADMLDRDNDLLSKQIYNEELELNQDFLDNSFEEANLYFKEEFLSSLESGESSEYVTELVENTDLHNITAGEIYNLRKEGYDLSSLFLVAGENFVSQADMGAGDTFTVNFGGNSSLNKNIGAGDILPMNRIEKVLINGVEGTRGFSPRPGYYSAEGKYLAIFDNYEIEIVSEKEYTPDEELVSKRSFQSRFDEVRGTELSTKFRNDLESNPDDSSFELDGYSESDLQYLQGYLQKYIPADEAGNINYEFDKENKTISTSNGESLKGVIKEAIPKGKGYEKYKAIVDEVTERYPNITDAKLTTLINHENAQWDPLASAPGSSTYGLGQMIDSTWDIYGKGLDRNNPIDQLEATCKYLDAIMERKGCSIELAMAYYNTGEGILKISDTKARDYAKLNPAIARKIPNGESMNAKTYFTGAVAYYNDIIYQEAKTKI